MAEANFQKRLLEEITYLLEPLLPANADADTLIAVLNDLGWSIEALLGSGTAAFIEGIQTAVESISEIAVWIETPPQSLGDFQKAFTTVDRLVKTLVNLPNTIPGFPGLDSAKRIPVELLEWLTIRYLRGRLPVFYGVLIALKVIDDHVVQEEIYSGVVVRASETLLRLDFERLIRLIGNPVGELRSAYSISALTTLDDVNRIIVPIFERLAQLAYMAGLQAVVGRGGAVPYLDAETEAAIRGMMTVWLPLLSPSAGDGEGEGSGAAAAIGATFRVLSAAEVTPGLLIAPFGEVGYDINGKNWQIHAELSGSVPGFVVGKSGVEIYVDDPNNVPARIKFLLSFVYTKAGDTTYQIGSTTGTRLEIKRFSAEINGEFEASAANYGFMMNIGEAKVVLVAGDGDGFLGKVLPSTPLEIPFDLGIGWSKKKGLYFKGGAGLEIALPIHKTFFDVVSINLVHLGVQAILASASDAPHIDLTGLISLKLKIGPFSASAERLGLASKIGFPSNNQGNMGIANVGIEFRLPSGIGLQIDEAGLVGGGYLSLDPLKGEYTGNFELSIKSTFTLKAVAIITTSPNNFSLFIVITVDFPGIALGLGFTLVGVGGLIGVNRTMVFEALKAGMKNNAVDSFLFPENPAVNAPFLVNNIRTFFPVSEGRFIFGFMVKLVWGVKGVSILTIKVGVILELPAPFRLVVLGQVRSVLPTAQFELVDLNMDIIGYIDLGRGEVSIEGTLHDSHILVFTISGDVLIRIRWSAQPLVILSFGGFHPKFVRPPGIPQLRRLSIDFATGANLRIRLETYLAITSNTIQIGANLDFYAKADIAVLGEFSISAFLGFDALIQFYPFYFIVDIYGGVSLRHNGKPFLGIQLYMTLEGPNPWHAWGRGEFYIIFKINIPFDLTVGNKKSDATREIVDPLIPLMEALKNPQSWDVQLPDKGSAPVNFRELGETKNIVVNPMGTISLRQRVLPLEQKLDKFGEAKPDNAGPFTIVSINVGTPELLLHPNRALKDYFAPAQFFAMSLDEKVARPSFEQYICGAVVTPGDLNGIEFGSSVSVVIEYETEVIDKHETVEILDATNYTPFGAVVAQLVPLGAAGRAPMRNTGATQFAGVSKQVTVQDARYVVTDRAAMQLVNGTTHESYIDARRDLRNSQSTNPDIQIVGAHEV